MPQSSLSIVIPAAGIGRRMKSRGPKALLPFGEENILGRATRVLRTVFSKGNVIVVAGFQAEKFVQSGFHLVHNSGYLGSNVGQSLRLGIEASPSKHDILWVYGDLLFNRTAFAGLPENSSWVLVDSHGRLRPDEVGVTLDYNCIVTNLSYGLPIKWAQIVCFRGREAALLRKVTASSRHDNHFGFEILNEIIDLGGSFRAVEPVSMQLAEVDTVGDIERAKALVGYA